MFLFKHNGKVYEAHKAKAWDKATAQQQLRDVENQLKSLGQKKNKPDEETLTFWNAHAVQEQKRKQLLALKTKLQDILNLSDTGGFIPGGERGV